MRMTRWTAAHLVLTVLAAAAPAFAAARAFAAAPALAAAASEEETIKARAIEFADAWNKHDPKAMAMLWAADGDLVNPFGRVARGRVEIETLFAEDHATIAKDTRYAITRIWVSMVEPKVAVATWDGSITGMKTADGSPMAPLEHMVTVVVVKRDGKWWTVAARAMIPAPPPAPVPAPAAPAPTGQ